MSKAFRNPSKTGIPYEEIKQHEPDDQQRLVIEGVGRSLVVNAGAGTGKTGTLTNAFVDALLTKEANGEPLMPENILAITYTNAAGNELKERVSDLLRRVGRKDLVIGMDDSWISTFNSFCARILSAHSMRVAELFNVDPAFRTIDEATVNSYRELAFQQALQSIRTKDSTAFALLTQDRNLVSLKKSLVSTLISIQVHKLGAEQIVSYPSDFQPSQTWEKRTHDYLLAFRELSSEFEKAFVELKQQHNVIDFSDQISYVDQLFKADKNILETYKNQFAIIFIDEFQDTNFVQLDIFKALSDGNLTVVGDGRQSVYAFQGADPNVFRSMLTGSKPVESSEAFNEIIKSDGNQKLEMRLSYNYRSHPEIIHAVNTIFSRDELFGREFVKLTPKRPSEPDNLPSKKRVSVKPVIGAATNTSTAQGAARWIAKEFRQLRDEAGYGASDMVILLRTRSKAQCFVEALQEEGLDSIVVGGDKLYEDNIIAQLVSMLTAIDNPLDNGAFTTAALSIFADVPDNELAELEAVRRKNLKSEPPKTTSYYRIALDIAGGAEQTSLGRFASTLQEAVSMRGSETPANILRYVISSSGLDELLLHSERSLDLLDSYEQSYVNLATVLDEVEEMQNSGDGFRDILMKLNLLLEAGKGAEDVRPPLAMAGVEETADAIKIMTAHSSKGLEFPIVAIPVLSSTARPGTVRTFFMRDEQSGEDRLLVGAKTTLTLEEQADVEERVKLKTHTYKAMGINSVSSSPFREYSGLDDGVKSRADEAALEEEKRLLYVAMTRARERLLIAYPMSKSEATLKARSDQLESKAAQLHAYLHRAIIRPEYNSLSVKTFDENFGTDVDCDFDASEIVALFSKEEAEESQPQDDGTASEGALSSEPPTLKEAAASEGATISTAALEEAEGVRVSIPLEPAYVYNAPTSGYTTSRHRLTQITATDIDRYETCPRQYRFRSVLRLGEITKPKTKTGPTEFGSALHALLEEAIASARRGAEPLSAEAIERIAAQHKLEPDYTKRLPPAVVKVMDTPYWNRAVQAGEAYAEAQFYEQLLDSENKAYFINGFIDLLVFENDDRGLVIDYKSGEWEGAREEHYKTQATVYAYAVMGRGAREVDVVFLRPEVIDDEAGIQEFTFKFDDAQKDSIAQFISEYKTKMEHTELLTDEDICKHVQGKDVCERCSFRGQLCPGYESTGAK